MQIVEELKENYPITKICEVINIPRRSYYSTTNKTLSKREIENNFILEKMKEIFKKSRFNYGIFKIQDALSREGIKVGHNRIARIKKENGIYPKNIKKYKVTTDSNHDNKVSPNILNRDFQASKPFEKLVSDITYISTLEGWLYLSTVIDLHNRKVIGWSMSDTLESKLITDSLKMALNGKFKVDNCIFHSDRGVQYTSKEVRNLLEKSGFIQSMSRKGNCWDNAVAESFFKILKYEGDINKVFKTKEEAKLCIFEFIEIFYNKNRVHSHLGYLTPDEFELQYFKMNGLKSCA